MGNVIVSPNIKRESVRIDPGGNIINSRTKEIIKPVEPEYVAPVETVAHETPTEPTENKISSKIDDMISKKIEEIINKKIEEALSKL